MYKFGILGCGKMGSAMLDGVLSSKLFTSEQIAVYSPHFKKSEKYSNINVLKSEKELCENSQIILLAIKPQMYAEVLEKIKGIDYSAKAIISLAPGKSISYLEMFFPDALIVRAMPNTPAVIQSATITAFSNNKGNTVLVADIKKIFSSLGSFEFLNSESDIDKALPLNGSMPAYIFAFIKEFVSCAEKNGIDRQQALNLCSSSIIGSVKLLQSSQSDIDTLINNVCSKGGTTIAGLDALYGSDFKKAVSGCYEACVKRSLELGE